MQLVLLFSPVSVSLRPSQLYVVQAGLELVVILLSQSFRVGGLQIRASMPGFAACSDRGLEVKISPSFSPPV